MARGDLPADVDVDELAFLLQAATMDALVRWAATTQSAAALRSSLSRRAEIVLRGAAAALRRLTRSWRQPAGQATDLVSRYWSKPAMPFWRPMPLVLVAAEGQVGAVGQRRR